MLKGTDFFDKLKIALKDRKLSSLFFKIHIDTKLPKLLINFQFLRKLFIQKLYQIKLDTIKNVTNYSLNESLTDYNIQINRDFLQPISTFNLSNQV
jgi:hypothetical protein